MSTKTSIIHIKRACIGCSLETYEKKTIKKEGSNCFHSNKSGLICGSCNCILCNDCVKQLYPAIQAKLSSIHKVYSPYIKALEHAYIKSDEEDYRQPPNSIGNCCFIKNLRAKEVLVEKRRWGNFQSFESESKKRKSMETPLTYKTMGGHMCLPEFDLIVETDFDSMDVIGLGGEKFLNGNKLKPCYHFVVDSLNAAELESRGVHPSFEMPTNWFRVDEKV